MQKGTIQVMGRIAAVSTYWNRVSFSERTGSVFLMVSIVAAGLVVSRLTGEALA